MTYTRFGNKDVDVGCQPAYSPPMYGDARGALDYCRDPRFEAPATAFTKKDTDERINLTTPWANPAKEAVVKTPSTLKVPKNLLKEETGTTFSSFLPSNFFDFIPQYSDPLIKKQCKDNKKCKKLVDRLKELNLPVPDTCCPAVKWPVPTVLPRQKLYELNAGVGGMSAGSAASSSGGATSSQLPAGYRIDLRHQSQIYIHVHSTPDFMYFPVHSRLRGRA